MTDYHFYYQDGRPVLLHDRVLVCMNRFAVVTKIVVPHSPEAIDWGIPEGAAMMDFDDGDCWGAAEFDEDFELVSRNYTSHDE